MYAGRMVESAPAHEIFANPRHAYTRALLNSIPRLEYERKSPLPAIPGYVPSPQDYAPGCRFCQRMGRTSPPERPPFIEVSPGHRVEACPHCATL